MRCQVDSLPDTEVPVAISFLPEPGDEEVTTRRLRPYSIRLDDPEFSRGRPVRQRQDDPFHQRQNCVFVLPLGPQNDNPGVPRRRVGPDVTEVQIECDQYAIFFLSMNRDYGIVCSREALIGDRISPEPGIAEKNCTFGRQILVDLESQTVCSKGRSSVPSRASSAA